MTVQQRELLAQLFDDALGLPPEQQKALLARNCPDPEVRQELESLLPFATVSPSERAVEAVGQAAASLAGAALIGQRVGPYRLIAHIGQGGMGTVYRAVRDDDQYRQTVAIKMLRFTHVENARLQLFRRERQILATLEHPHIARLLDGGAWIPPGSAENQPYIVMEYVDGVPIDTWCDQHKLDIDGRLALFREVCEGVQHAHQHLILHRDLKPANILVTTEGHVKLLDFGIAKLLASDPTGSAEAGTGTLLRIMTPEYASPEQAKGEPVTTMSDVYSLGVLLYELVTGRRPYQLRDRNPYEVVRAICEEEPLHPSVVPQANGDAALATAETIGASRGATPDQLRRQLKGDLDSIILKALQKDPAQRYASVEYFHEDVRKYLSGLRVTARADTLLYRTTKFVQRHRVVVALLFLAIASLGIGLLTTFWQLQILRRELRTVEAQLALSGMTQRRTTDLYTPEILLFIYTNLVFSGVTGWLTRASPRRLAGALAGGACFSMVMFGTDYVARLMGWWQSAFPAERVWLWMYLACAFYGSTLCLVGWRSARRFGWRGQAVFLAAMGMCGVAKKFSGATVSQILVFHVGFTALAVTSVSWAFGFGLAQGLMRLVAGPARSDRLARTRLAG
jgi:eukaryotic-like serine/threonine-protein kinase